MRPREFKQRRNGILRVEANDLGAQFTRLLLGIDQATLCFGIDSERVLFGRLNVNDKSVCIESPRQTGTAPQQGRRTGRMRIQANHDPLARHCPM